MTGRKKKGQRKCPQSSCSVDPSRESEEVEDEEEEVFVKRGLFRERVD